MYLLTPLIPVKKSQIYYIKLKIDSIKNYENIIFYCGKWIEPTANLQDCQIATPAMELEIQQPALSTVFL
jgi:hypothetical protein